MDSFPRRLSRMERFRQQAPCPAQHRRRPLKRVILIAGQTGFVDYGEAQLA